MKIKTVAKLQKTFMQQMLMSEDHMQLRIIKTVITLLSEISLAFEIRYRGYSAMMLEDITYMTGCSQRHDVYELAACNV